jgi:hypothetical protein
MEAERTPRSILLTPARADLRRAAAQATLAASVGAEIVFRVAVLGGRGAGKSAILRALGGDRSGGSGARYAPTLGPETATVYAANFRGRSVLLHLVEVPFELAAAADAEAEAEAGGGGGAGVAPVSAGALRPGSARLQLRILLRDVHAALVVVDARDGGRGLGLDGVGSAGEGTMLETALCEVLSQRGANRGSFEAADTLRRVLERELIASRVETAAAAVIAASAAAATSDDALPWRPPASLPLLLLLHKADYPAVAAAGLEAAEAIAAASSDEPLPPSRAHARVWAEGDGIVYARGLGPGDLAA